MSTTHGSFDSFERHDHGVRHSDRTLQSATEGVDALSHAVVELARDGIVIADAQGRITFVNRRSETLFGYPRRELLGQPIEVLIPQGLHDAHWAAPDMHPTDNEQELFGRRADGSEFPVDIALAPVAIDGVMHTVATCRDATARLQVAQQLREQNELLTRAFDTVSEAMYIYDRTGRILQMNPAARAFAEYDTGSELASRSLEERASTFRPRDPQGSPLPLEAWPVSRVLQGETLSPAVPLELLTTSPTGHELVTSVTGVPLRDTNGAIVGAVLACRDITEQRRLERELAARVQELESIFETAADAVMLFDTEGRALRMNAAQRRLLGYETIGRATFLLPEERVSWFPVADAQGTPLPQEAWPMYRVLRGETLTGEHVVEIRLRTLDGRMIQVSMSGAPVRDAEGRIVGGVTAARDVTAQRQAEQQRADVLRMLAPDVASPIAAVSWYLQSQRRILERGGPPRPPEEESQLLGELSYAVSRIQRLLGDMRVEFGLKAHELSLDLRPCDLAALCQRQAQAMQTTTERAVHVVLPPSPVVVSADPDRLGQVVSNLLSNADRYSPLESPITLTLRLEPLESHGSHKSSPQSVVISEGAEAKVNQQARVLIRDEGLGMPPEEHAYLWEPFHRIPGAKARSGAGGGSGFELYICHELIERHGGAIGVESSPGKGSTFWFTLPLATGEGARV